MGSGKGGKSQTQTVTNRVDVPSFLQPLVNQQARISGDALTNLRRQLGQGDLVAGFNPDQQQAFGLARLFATGQDGFLPTAQNTFMGAAQGQPVSSFLDPAALSALSGAAQGSGFEDFLPPLTMQTLGQMAQGQSLPGQSQLQQILGANPIPQQTMDTLQQTAQGDFLFGGQGFDQAVDAAVRAAQPHILSTFGRGGAGAATGGLAQTAIARSAQDAFANQFAQERQNQLGAANTLGSLGLAGRGQSADIAGLLGNLGLSQGAQRIQSAGLLGDFASQERGRQLGAAGQLAGLSDAERSRQLQAAGALPGLGAIGSDVLGRIGALQQAQSQQELMSPIMAQQQLLAAAGGGVPLGALLGSTGTQTTPMQSNTFGNVLGGASTGFQMFGPWGALGGGLLGLLG